MAKRETREAAGLPAPREQAQRGGSPKKAAHHEGPAGSGESRDLGNAKFNKEGRDSVPPASKEAGKSRGPGG